MEKPADLKEARRSCCRRGLNRIKNLLKDDRRFEMLVRMGVKVIRVWTPEDVRFQRRDFGEHFVWWPQYPTFGFRGYPPNKRQRAFIRADLQVLRDALNKLGVLEKLVSMTCVYEFNFFRVDEVGMAKADKEAGVLVFGPGKRGPSFEIREDLVVERLLRLK